MQMQQLGHGAHLRLFHFRRRLGDGPGADFGQLGGFRFLISFTRFCEAPVSCPLSNLVLGFFEGVRSGAQSRL
jgi:hypothetical protein